MIVGFSLKFSSPRDIFYSGILCASFFNHICFLSCLLSQYFYCDKKEPTKALLPPTTEASTAVPAARSRMVICHEDDGDDQDDSDDTV